MIKLKNIHLTIVFTNLLGEESLAPEKACRPTVLFARSKLKITMKRHVPYCVRQLVVENIFYY